MTAPGHARLRPPACRDHVLYSRHGGDRYADRCQHCGGLGLRYSRVMSGESPDDCDQCGGIGWTGIDPTLPTCAPPGSFERTIVYQARCLMGHAEHGLSWPEDAGNEAWTDAEHEWQPLAIQGKRSFELEMLRGEVDEDDDWDF